MIHIIYILYNFWSSSSPNEHLKKQLQVIKKMMVSRQLKREKKLLFNIFSIFYFYFRTLRIVINSHCQKNQILQILK